MPSSGLVRKESLVVQLLRFIEPFHGQALRRQAFGRYQSDALAELAFQALPAFVVKFGSQPQSFLLQFGLAFLEESVKGYSELVVLRPVFGYPFVHDLGIAQLAEFAEQLFGEGTQLVPSGGGIDLPHYRCDGAAAP